MNNSRDICWKEGRLLPSLPAPAANLDALCLENASDSEALLFTTLKGIVNRRQPRIWTMQFPGAGQEWLDLFHHPYTPADDGYSLILKYRAELQGLIVYDETIPDTINLATSMASVTNCLVVNGKLAETLSRPPYALAVRDDLRGRFKGKMEVYQYLLDAYAPRLSTRILAGINPESVFGYLRDYIVALQTPVVWLDPDQPEERALLDCFLSRMPSGSVYMGWWGDEHAGIAAASEHNVVSLASDWSRNLSVLGGIPGTPAVRELPPLPPLENKIYVGFVLADGDNLQYMENVFRDRWNNPDRGSIPMGWTMNPVLLDAAPAILEWITSTASAQDCLVCGPSGAAYTYPNLWNNQEQLDEFIRRSENYCKKSGVRVLTLWADGVDGDTKEEVGVSYARCAPSLLGITSQKRDSGWRIYNGTLPGVGIWGNYCSKVTEMRESVELGSREYDGTAPCFIMIQPVPWQLSVSDVIAFAKELGSDYEVVRPDTLFRLFRQHNGLSVDPA